MADHGIPSIRDLMWPVLEAIRELGDSARNREIFEKVVEQEGFTEEQQSVRYAHSGDWILENRLTFARSGLKKIGMLDNPEKAVWVLTERGRTAAEDQIESWLKEEWKRDRIRKKEELDSYGDGDNPDRWKADLLKRLQAMSPDDFGLFVQPLLHEAGNELCDLLKKYELGVKVTTRTIEDVEIDTGFFDRF